MGTKIYGTTSLNVRPFLKSPVYVQFRENARGNVIFQIVLFFKYIHDRPSDTIVSGRIDRFYLRGRDSFSRSSKIEVFSMIKN